MKKIDTYKNNSGNPEHPDENELAQYAEYLVYKTGQVPDSLIDHVASCRYCRGELMAITDLLDSLPEVAEEPVQPVAGYELSVAGRSRFTGFKLLRTVAAVAAVALIALGIKQLLPDRPINEPIATSNIKDATPIPDSLTANPKTDNLITDNLITDNKSSGITLAPDTVLFASAFIPNPVYENLVGAKYRSGNDPNVAGPGPGTVFAPGDTLKLTWTPDPRDEYVLIILDNRANSVKEIRPGPASAGLSWKIDLKPGLYYWKFLGKEEMWKVGKMKICTAI